MFLEIGNSYFKRTGVVHELRFFLGVMTTLFFGVMGGCGASSPYYKNKDERSVTNKETVRPDKPEFTLFFIGDSGSPSTKPLEPNLQVLHHHLKSAGKNSAVVFLGDNIYSYGLRPPGHPKRPRSERRINAQLQILEDYEGTPVFIPGNHDWNDDLRGGWEAIRRQQEYIENRLGPAAFAPDNGCPGPTEVRMDSANILLLIDTEWWLYPHEKPGLERCPNGSKEHFIHAVDSLLHIYHRQNIFVAAHHPLYSNGTHGGYFPATDHLFPLLDIHPALYMPLPIVGSINPLYRKYFGYRQDLSGNDYNQLREQLTQVFQQHPRLIYAAGHDHSLQYHPIGNQHYIVAGGGTVKSYVRKGKSAAFAYSHKGFARIDIFDNEVVLSFWIQQKDRPRGRLVYQKVLYTY